MSDPVTQPTNASVADFISAVEPDVRREDALTLDALFQKVTGERPAMWGPSIIGYGAYRTTYASGREVQWLRTGFSPRKARQSLYLMGGYCDAATGQQTDALLERLGPHSRGKSCLYITRLARVDLGVLEELVRTDWQAMARLYPA